MHKLRSEGKVIKMCLIPSNTGITGNEDANKAAVAAAARPEQYISVYYKDFYPMIKQAIEG